MPTINQLIRGARKPRTKVIKYIALSYNWNSLKEKFSPLKRRGNPQRSVICRKVGKMTPVKPNSALRSFGSFSINSGKNKISAYIPGAGHNVQEYSRALISPHAAARDLRSKGVRYGVIRNYARGDVRGVVGRKQSRSLYGAKKEQK